MSAGGGLSVEAAVDACRPWSMKLTVQVKLSSMSASIWNPPVTSKVVNPWMVLRSIRRAWISWLGSSWYPRSMAAPEAITRAVAAMSGSSGPAGWAALAAAYRPGAP